MNESFVGVEGASLSYGFAGEGATIIVVPGGPGLSRAYLEAIRRHVGVERPHVLAHSFGGLVALAHAGRYPNCVDRLVLVEADPVRKDDWELFRERIASRRSAADSSASPESDTFPSWRIPKSFARRFSSFCPRRTEE